MNMKTIMKRAAALLLGVALAVGAAAPGIMTQGGLAASSVFAAESKTDKEMTLVINEEQTIEYTGPVGKISVDGTLLEDLPLEPVTIDDGYFLVPLREVFEAVGAEVLWDNDTRIATVKNGEVEMKFKPMSTSAFVNGEELLLGSAPQLIRKAEDINSKVMVPLRFIMENLGKNVVYNLSLIHIL